MVDSNNTKTPKLDRSGTGRILTVFGTLLVFGLLLFSLGGRLNWWEAWAFLAIYLAGLLANAWWMIRHDPELINERGRISMNVRPWEKGIELFYMLFLAGMIVIPALDARFGWSAVPLWVKVVGALGFIISMALPFWALRVNTFLSNELRIQAERGHTTVTTGPYRLVRHPMYAGKLFMSWGMPLLLGSWWALIPGLLNIALFFVRTSLEDRTLQAELPGYQEYVQKVRYRLVPGIW